MHTHWHSLPGRALFHAGRWCACLCVCVCVCVTETIFDAKHVHMHEVGIGCVGLRQWLKQPAAGMEKANRASAAAWYACMCVVHACSA